MAKRRGNEEQEFMTSVLYQMTLSWATPVRGAECGLVGVEISCL